MLKKLISIRDLNNHCFTSIIDFFDNKDWENFLTWGGKEFEPDFFKELIKTYLFHILRDEEIGVELKTIGIPPEDMSGIISWIKQEPDSQNRCIMLKYKHQTFPIKHQPLDQLLTKNKKPINFIINLLPGTWVFVENIDSKYLKVNHPQHESHGIFNLRNSQVLVKNKDTVGVFGQWSETKSTFEYLYSGTFTGRTHLFTGAFDTGTLDTHIQEIPVLKGRANDQNLQNTIRLFIALLSFFMGAHLLQKSLNSMVTKGKVPFELWAGIVGMVATFTGVGISLTTKCCFGSSSEVQLKPAVKSSSLSSILFVGQCLLFGEDSKILEKETSSLANSLTIIACVMLFKVYYEKLQEKHQLNNIILKYSYRAYKLNQIADLRRIPIF